MAAFICGEDEMTLPATPVERARLPTLRTLSYRLGSAVAHTWFR